MILAAKALLDENPEATEMDIRENLHGNICRCTGYVKIVEAIEAVRDGLAQEKPVSPALKGGRIDEV